MNFGSLCCQTTLDGVTPGGNRRASEMRGSKGTILAKQSGYLYQPRKPNACTMNCGHMSPHRDAVKMWCKGKERFPRVEQRTQEKRVVTVDLFTTSIVNNVSELSYDSGKFTST